MAPGTGLALARCAQGTLVAAVLVALAAGCRGSASPAPKVPVTQAHAGVPRGAEEVRVIYVIDGDTLIVRPIRRGGLLNEKSTVRLLEIDAPESKDPDGPVECFGVRSTRALARLLPVGSVAWVQRDRELRDRYGRLLLYLWNTDGVFVNERLIKRGFARAALFEPNDRYIDLMRSVESEARASRSGLWGACPR